MFRKFLRSLVILLALTSTVSCAAVQAPYAPLPAVPVVGEQMLTLRADAVLNGIGQALSGKVAGAEVLRNGANPLQLIFTWTFNGARATFAIDLGACKFLSVKEMVKAGGGLASSKTAADLLHWLEGNGWSVVKPEELPAISAALASATFTRMLSMPVLLFAPAALEIEDFGAWFEQQFLPVEVEL